MNTPKLSDSPKVSVIICCYNQQDFIRQTVESVLAQTYPNLEIIISDDGSTDATPAILQDYAQRHSDKIKIGLSDRNTGIPANINRGMAHCTGELRAWLDGDDLMLPQKLEKQVALLQQHTHAVGCYTDADVFESETGQTLGLASLLYNGSTTLKQGQLATWFLPRYFVLPSTIMARSKACPAHGFDERLKYKSDILFFAETLRQGHFLALAEPLTRYRRHAQNLTTNSQHRDASLEYELMMCAIWDARYPEQRAVFHRMRRAALIVEALKAHREGNPARRNAILLNLFKEGEWVRAPALALGLAVLGKKASAITGSPNFSRPSWVARLSQAILQ